MIQEVQCLSCAVLLCHASTPWDDLTLQSGDCLVVREIFSSRVRQHNTTQLVAAQHQSVTSLISRLVPCFSDHDGPLHRAQGGGGLQRSGQECLRCSPQEEAQSCEGPDGEVAESRQTPPPPVVWLFLFSILDVVLHH